MLTTNFLKIKSLRLILSFVISVSFFLNGCHEKIDDDNVGLYDASQPVTFTTQIDVVTRGTPINSVADMTSIGVFASSTGASDWNTTSVPGKMFNTRLNNEAGKWTYVNGDVHWKAENITDRYTFFAYAPYAEGETVNGIAITSSATSPGIPSLKYTVPTDVSKQPDLMVAVPRYNMRPTGNVPLQMKHALTGIGFQIAGNGDEKITGISISGVRVSGYLLVDGSNIVWMNLGAPTNTDFSASLNYDAGKNYYSVTKIMSNNLITSDGYLMMIPQELGDDAKVKITFEDKSTREISLTTHTWEAGKRINYLVTLTADGTITVTPDKVALPYTAQEPAQQYLTVHAQSANGDNDPNAAWTLTAAEAWLKLSLNPNGSPAQTSVSGKGTQNVYLVASENTNTSLSRTSNIYMGDNHIDVVTLVTQMKNPGTIGGNEGGAGTPASGRTYVGAFWRAGETGERLIRINSDYAGEWTASVIWMDGRWGVNDGIILDMENIDNDSFNKRGISFTSKMEPDNYGTPEDYPVTGSAAVITGDATSANKYIIFRIGLKSKYTPTLEHPARYAVILLSYDNNTKHQKIFLRQGENPDYLMNNKDAFHPQSDFKSSRTMSRKFAVYNLTAEKLDDVVAYRGAIFTKYPTQAGALWAWGTNPSNYGTLRKAYNPAVAPTINEFGVNSQYYWNTLGVDNEVSPDKFSRPTAGITNNSQPKDNASNSEMRQSLFWKIVYNDFNYSSSMDNSVWGYYADGFFDRRQIEDENTVLRNEEYNIAHIGRLFFNPISGSERYNASLFFPAAGWILKGGHLTNVGVDANYWSSSANHEGGNYYGLGLILRDNDINGASLWREDKFSAASIRPVLKLTDDGITVSPYNVALPHTSLSPASQSLSVTSTKGGNPDPSAQWTLSSNKTWLWLSLNADGSNAVYPTISGTGSRNVYLVVGKNSDNAPRTAEIFLNGNSADVVTIVKSIAE